MPSPFPGMDPYLESPEIWPDVHHELISQIRAALNPALRPSYVARVELRVYATSEEDPGLEVIIPDVRVDKTAHMGPRSSHPETAVAVAEPLIVPVFFEEEIEEAFIEIRHLESKRLVTIIEVLSPSNKVQGSNGRASLLKKKHEAISSKVHWVEIDLLRAGAPTITRPPLRSSDYRVLLTRAGKQNQASYWPISMRQALPVIGVPLRKPDPDMPLDLAAVFKSAYENGAYDLSIDYRKKPNPPLEGTDRTWAGALLRQHQLR